MEQVKSIVPAIMVDNCRGAIEYYRNVFGGELKNVMTGVVK